MKSSQHTRSETTGENIYKNSKCPCAAKQDYTRKSNRTPLSDIQGSANKNYLSVEYGKKGKTGTRSKSLSLSSNISPIKAESTRITPAPLLKQPLTKIPVTLTVRPTQKTESHKQSLPIAPIRTRSSSCQCSGTQNAETNKKETVKTHKKPTSDDVFLQPTLFKPRTQSKHCPTSTKLPVINVTQESLAAQNNKYFYDSHNSKHVCTGISTISKAKSAEDLSRGYKLKPNTPNKQRSDSRNSWSTSRIPQITQDGDNFIPLINPDLLTSVQKNKFTPTKLIATTERKAQGLVSNSLQPYTSLKENQGSTKPISCSSKGPQTSTISNQYHACSTTKASTTNVRDLVLKYVKKIASPIENQAYFSTKSVPSLSKDFKVPETYHGYSSTKSSTSEQTIASSIEKQCSDSTTKSGVICSLQSSQHSKVPKQYQESTKSTTEVAQDLPLEYVQIPREYQACNFTEPTTTSKGDSEKYTTLPSQNFVTLSQDTLISTLCSETVSLNNVKMVRDSSLFSEEDKTFIDAQKFLQGLKPGSTFKTVPVCSPLNINVPIRRSNGLSECETEKRVKTTLRRKSSIKKVIICPLIYSPEYLEDMISYSYKQMNNFLLKAEWVDKYIDRRYRTVTINWLLQVKELVSPNFDPAYYMAVRIFDYTVIRLRLRKSYYQLVAIVAFWISLKYLDNSVSLKIPKMYALCNGQYSKEEILSMERTILKSIKCYLNISDPLDFLHYYLKSANLEKDELLKYGCKFVMECVTLFENYPLLKPPYLAASALYLAYTTLTKSKDVYVNFIWLDRKKVQAYAEDVLAINVRYVIMEKFEPLNKYLTPEKLQVAKRFFYIQYKNS